MESTRRLLSIGALVLAALWLALGLLVVNGEKTLVPHTIENSRSIETAFAQTASYVSAFQASESRLPNEAEFEAWTSTQPPVPYMARYVHLFTSDLPQPAIAALGAPPPGSYVLGYWRDDWEYYAGWSGDSTLLFDPSAYYVLGTFLADFLAVLAVGAILLLGAWWLRPNNSFKRNRFAVRLNSGVRPQGENNAILTLCCSAFLYLSYGVGSCARGA